MEHIFLFILAILIMVIVDIVFGVDIYRSYRKKIFTLVEAKFWAKQLAIMSVPFFLIMITGVILLLVL